MKMVFLYGPPAAGKYTVAMEIGRLTGFRVFHNHLTIDAVLPVFEFGSPPFGKVLRVMRAAVLAEAAREGRDLVFTSVLATPGDFGYYEEMCAAVESNGGKVHLVLLTSRPEVLEERVLSDHRASGSKLSTVEGLRETLARFDVTSPMPGRQSLRIDNTDLTPEETALRVIKHFGLSTTSSE